MKEHNLRNLSEIMKQKVKKFLKHKQTWDINNLESTCNQVVDHFSTSEALKDLKDTLQEELLPSL